MFFFVLEIVNVKQWWIWGYWISPMMYGMNAIAVNEFLGHQWNHVSIEYLRFKHVLVILFVSLSVELLTYGCNIFVKGSS